MEKPTNPRHRVAVVGASGIGRHHANWWHAEGAEVCAFAGRTPDSVAATARKLAALFPFAGRGYTDLGELLAAERPGLVDVCSPPECHAAHVRAALAAGCDVLCEKPFVYDARTPPGAWLAEARELAAAADAAGRSLALCTQYTQVARLCLAARGGAAPLRRFEAVLRAPARGRAPDPRYIWIDLAPHLLGALAAAEPEALPLWETLRVEVQDAGYTVTACFEAQAGDGRRLPCRLEAGFNTGEPGHCRRLVLDGEPYDIGGENGPDGYFRTRLVRPGHADAVHEDTLRLLIREQLAGRPALPAPRAVQNLAWSIAVWQRLG